VFQCRPNCARNTAREPRQLICALGAQTPRRTFAHLSPANRIRVYVIPVAPHCDHPRAMFCQPELRVFVAFASEKHDIARPPRASIKKPSRFAFRDAAQKKKSTISQCFSVDRQRCRDDFQRVLLTRIVMVKIASGQTAAAGFDHDGALWCGSLPPPNQRVVINAALWITFVRGFNLIFPANHRYAQKVHHRQKCCHVHGMKYSPENIFFFFQRANAGVDDSFEISCLSRDGRPKQEYCKTLMRPTSDEVICSFPRSVRRK